MQLEGMRQFFARWWYLATYFVVFVGLRWILGIDGFWNEVALSSLVAGGLLMVALAWRSP
jgi:hypothetical protein